MTRRIQWLAFIAAAIILAIIFMLSRQIKILLLHGQ